MGQLYYSPITINSGQVPSTQTDFPVLVSQTDNRFKTTGNGGHVNNSSGFDIRPYSDTGLTSALSYELERYNASTGEVIMWVKVGSLSSSTTPIYLGYGDTSLTTDGSSGINTFSNNFTRVYHLKDGSTLSLTDSSSSNVTANNVNTVTATTGQIDGGASFASASSQYLGCGTTRPAAITLSCWINATSFPGSYNATVDNNDKTESGYAVMLVKSNGKLACFVFANADVSFDGTGTTTLSTSTWYYLSMTYSSSAGLIGYINGTQEKTAAANGALKTTAPNEVLLIGAQDGTPVVRFWNGKIDEARVASVARSADWITTEYNNQNAPGTFETLGTEVAVATSTGNMFLLFP